MILPTYIDDEIPLIEFVNTEERSNQQSADNRLNKEQKSIDSPLFARSVTLEVFWVNMDGRGETIPKREETTKG